MDTAQPPHEPGWLTKFTTCLGLPKTTDRLLSELFLGTVYPPLLGVAGRQPSDFAGGTHPQRCSPLPQPIWRSISDHPNAVMMCASLTTSYLPDLTEHFERIAYGWIDGRVDTRLIEQERPTIVFQEMVEFGTLLPVPGWNEGRVRWRGE